ncbi:VOC family protein [Pedobacter sp. SAFR-022]|uniref:VOC family protein n=1 Tax=Pedobacter sp. SAFR-022 TaxID=3436861 RepID=UPI003F81A87E
MNTSIFPCIWYDGNAEEAATFYCKAFEGASMSTCTPLIVTFQIKGRQFMGMNGGPGVKPNPSISFFNICASAEEIQNAWDLLAAEGLIMMPLDQYPWNERYGWVQDKFGVCWQLMLADAQNKPDVFPALMFAGEQNGRAQQAIDLYTSLFNNASIEVLAKYEPGEGDIPGNIKHAQIMLDGMRLGAMESSMQHNFQFNWGVSLVINCDTQEEIDFFWLNLTEGGKESKCGWCQDAFGVWWQVVPSILGSLMTDPDKAPKVMDAFLKMTKFDIEAIKRAAA